VVKAVALDQVEARRKEMHKRVRRRTRLVKRSKQGNWARSRCDRVSQVWFVTLSSASITIVVTFIHAHYLYAIRFTSLE
jgi:hypothetical protein